jgi:hypothetical protein
VGYQVPIENGSNIRNQQYNLRREREWEKMPEFFTTALADKPIFSVTMDGQNGYTEILKRELGVLHFLLRSRVSCPDLPDLCQILCPVVLLFNIH